MNSFKRRIGKIWKYVKVFAEILSASTVLTPFVLAVISYLVLFINVSIVIFPSWLAQVMLYITIILTIFAGFAFTARYLKRTQTRFFAFREFYSYFEQFGEYLQNHAYSYSICSMFGNIQRNSKENEYFTQIFENLGQKYKKLKEDLEQTEIDGNFPSKVREFNEIIEGYSKLVIDFVPALSQCR